jgi:hypothetical protein
MIWAKVSGRHITTKTEFGSGHFPDTDDKEGPRNVGLLAIQPPDWW